MYTFDGASFNPNIKLSKKNATQMIQNDSAKPNEMKVAMAGVITSMIAFRRPSASDRKPLRKLPNGWPIFDKLAAWQNDNSNDNCIGSFQKKSTKKLVLTQPWCFSACYSNRFVWILCGGDAKQWWYYKRCECIKNCFV